MILRHPSFRSSHPHILSIAIIILSVLLISISFHPTNGINLQSDSHTPGRTTIKINPGPTTPTPTPTPTRGQQNHGESYRNRRASPGAIPELFRPPHPIQPPPFLQPPMTTTISAEFGQQTMASSMNGLDESETVMASYYDVGDSEVDSNSEAEAQGVTQDATNPVQYDSSNEPNPTDSSASSSTGSDSSPSDLPPIINPNGWNTDLAAWSALNGNCYTHTTTAYVYSFCPYQNITQKSTSTILHVVLGVWDSWIETGGDEPIITPTTTSTATTSTANEPPSTATTTPTPPAPSSESTTTTTPAVSSPPGLIMFFTDGTGCAGNKRRQTKVHFVCAPLTRIGDVSEPQTCEYEVLFHTPLMCDAHELAAPVSQTTSDAIKIQSMQECIHLLYEHATDPAPIEPGSTAVVGDLPFAVQRACAAFLPELRHSFSRRPPTPPATPPPSSTTTSTSERPPIVLSATHSRRTTTRPLTPGSTTPPASTASTTTTIDTASTPPAPSSGSSSTTTTAISPDSSSTTATASIPSATASPYEKLDDAEKYAHGEL